ncbi:16230_t:CDS:2 [Funneliformis geosporum]|uniref:16230_t:CDS:1 n=1 Tax=Funneliformis geosporum TaxID=1117311 RepID=A0A9W4SHE8_9GLOM|nr:16230_t:CDS:2 [Funneliformis geosporum]
MDVNFKRDLQHLVITLCRILFNNIQENSTCKSFQQINQRMHHGDISCIADLNPFIELFRTAKYLQFETVTFNYSSSTIIFNYQWDPRDHDLNLNHLIEISKYHYQSFIPFIYKIDRWRRRSLESLTTSSILSHIEYYLPGFKYLYDFHWITDSLNLSLTLPNTYPSEQEPGILFLTSDFGVSVVVVIKRYCEDLMYESSYDLAKDSDDYVDLVKKYKKYAADKHANKLLTVIGATYTEDPNCLYPFKFVDEIDSSIARSVQLCSGSTSTSSPVNIYQAPRQETAKSYDPNTTIYGQSWVQPSEPAQKVQPLKMPINPGKSAPVVGADWVYDNTCENNDFDEYNYLNIPHPDGYNVLLEIGQTSNVQIFRAHSIILRARCSYFKSALSNDWCKKDDNDMIIFKKPNILPNIFKVILNYLYTGTLDLTDLTNSELIHLLEATDELALEELFSHIQEHLIIHSSEYIKQNPNLVIDIAFKHDAFTNLQTFCVDLITQDPQPFFSSTLFESTDISILTAILSRDDIRMKEIALWNQIIQWGLHNSHTQVDKDEIEHDSFDDVSSIDFVSLKSTLSPLLPLIRFSDISSKDYETKVKPFQSILPLNLSTLLCRYHFENNNGLDPINLNLGPRKPPYNINSTIINHKHAALIANWIDSNEGNLNVNGKIQYGKIRFNLLYRGSKHLFSFERFHKMCDNQGPSLVLIKIKVNNNDIEVDRREEIIGGYNPVGWQSANQYITRDDSFIFNLGDLFESKYILSRIQPNLKNYAIYDGENFGPSFGKGDMEFSCTAKPREGFCRWRCYDKPIRHTEDRFWVEEIEVFKVVQ